MTRRSRLGRAACALAIAAVSAVPLGACAPRHVTCETTCGDPAFACVAGECLREGRLLEVGALDKFGQLQSRRLLYSPVAAAVVRPGDGHASLPDVATLARARDAGSLLLLRFAVDLPPGTTVVEAHLLLDRAPAVDVDPAPIVVHAARIAEPWEPRSTSWARVPRIEEVDPPRTTVSSPRRVVRLDVRSLVRRWRLHASSDQGIALVTDRASPSGMAFALADGSGSTDDAPAVPPLRPSGSPLYVASSEHPEGTAEAAPPRAPRLELYVKP